MKLTRLFLVSIGLALAASVTLYAAAFYYQFGAPIEASYDVRNWRLLKETLADQAVGERVLLISDSNILFGMDSAYAEQELGKPVINMGLHGGLPLDWILNVALHKARSGDIVVFPLYFGIYMKDYQVPNDWMVDQIIAWDKPYFDGLSPLRKLKYVAAISLDALYRNIRTKENLKIVINEHSDRKLLSPEKALAYYKEVAHMQSAFSYSYLNMNQHGDMRNTCGVKTVVDARGHLDYIKMRVDETSISLLLDVTQRLTKRGVKVFFAAPVQVDDQFSRSPEYQEKIRMLWERLRKEGLPLLGGALDYYFPPQAFFNTEYHLNCDFSKERTKILVTALKSVL
jgi:hypothetical protein